MTDANQHLVDLVDGNKKPARRPVSVFGIVALVFAVVEFLVAFVDREVPKSVRKFEAISADDCKN